jgi:hypothetical protein
MSTKTNIFIIKEFFQKCLSSRNKTSWSSVPLEEFMSCPQNLGFNRQTRMLAKYGSKFSQCDYLYKRTTSHESYDEILLKRAQRGLLSLDFFGLKEYQEHSRLLFLSTFNNSFKYINGLRPWTSWKVMAERKKTEDTLLGLNENVLKRIKFLNNLDLKLYKYAFEIFVKRLRHFNII